MLSISLLLLLSTFTLKATISGVVYQDLPINNNQFNTYGEKDENELGIPGVKVTAYPSLQTTITNHKGEWSLPLTSRSRIEFTNLPKYLKESPLNSSIQFLDNNETEGNLALHDSTDYTTSINPKYVTNLQQNGQAEGQYQSSIEIMNYSDRGLNTNYLSGTGELGTAPAPIILTRIHETGSVWGKAIQKDKVRLFASTVLQRHIGFAPSKITSSEPTGEIFVINYQTSKLLGSFNLHGKIPTNGGVAIDLGTVCRDISCINTNDRTGIPRDYLLDTNKSEPNIDLDAFAKVGKVAYGDISFDEHTNKLWLINLKQRALISVDAKGDFNSLANADIEQYPLDSIQNTPSCTGGVLRPWAIKIHHDKIYIGAVCDASISQNKSHLKAYVLSTSTLSPTKFKEELKIDLDYDKDGSDWNPWSDTDKKVGLNWKEYIQPILSNIEFDKENNMYLSFLDRYGLQAGYLNYTPESNTTDLSRLNREKTHSSGEIFKVCDINGTFGLEGHGLCTQVNYPNSSEFFNDIGGSGNLDASMGSIALLAGSNQILATIIDPHPEGIKGKEYWNTLGTSTLNLSDGRIDNWYANIYSGNKEYGYNGKSQGMGEIEILTAPAPLEIGNRIWLDTNANGVQDANEIGIANVKIELICNGNLASSTITNSEGNYLFSNDQDKLSTDNYQYNIQQLSPANKNNCLLSIPNIKGNQQQDALHNLILTQPFVGEGNNSKQNDSNGENHNQLANISITASDIPYAGANNNSFDIGFKPKPQNVSGTTNNVQTDDEETDDEETDDEETDDEETDDLQNIGENNHSGESESQINPQNVLGATVCQEMIVNDDVQSANQENTITRIPVINNDQGTKSGQEIRFLPLTEGEFLWKNKEQNITVDTTLDILIIEGEGTWSVQDNEVVFTPLNSFDGKIPTPVYYVIRGNDCTLNTQFSNVGQVRINTACHCPTYTTKSVSSFNILSMLFLMLITISLSILHLNKELDTL